MATGKTSSETNMVAGAKSEWSIPARAMPNDAGNQADMAAAAASSADVPGRRAAPAPPDPGALRKEERERSPRSRRARSASPRQRDRNEEGGIGILFRNLVTDQQEDRKRIVALEKMIAQMQAEDKVEKDVKELQDQFAPDAFAKHMNNVMDNNLNEKLVTKMREIDNAVKLLNDAKEMADKETTKLQLNLGDLSNEFNTKINKIELYLGDLEATRPKEGRTVVEAFAYLQAQVVKVQEDMVRFAANVQQAIPAAPSSGATSSGGAAGLGLSEGGAYMVTYMTHETELRKVRGAMEDFRKELDVLKVKAHQDERVDALQLQLDSLAEATKIAIGGQLVQAAAHGAGPLLQAAVAGPLLQAAARCTGHLRPEAAPGTGPMHGGPAHGAEHPGQGHGGGVPGFPGGFPGAGAHGGGVPNGGGFPTGPGGGGRGGPPGGSGPPWFVATRFGGNNVCHCMHVVKLQDQMREVMQRLATLERSTGAGGRPPLIPSGIDLPDGVPHFTVNTPPQSFTTLPLALGPLGGLPESVKTGRLFDDRMTAQEGYKFDGTKGGDRWKGKLERYFMSKCPALRNILAWAEKTPHEEISEDLLTEAVGGAMDGAQRETLSSAVWGFLSNCVSGEAETMFKRADPLNGIDAWRKMVRYIDHGRSIRCETLRAELRTIHLRPIKNLESLNVGIAEFENKHQEYVEAGGTDVRGPEEKKADLLAVLPEQLRENLLWRATDEGTYEQFKAMVQGQAAKVLLNRRRLPVHNVNLDEQQDPDGSAAALIDVESLIAALKDGRLPEGIPDVESLIAAIKGGRFQPRRDKGKIAKTKSPGDTRPPRQVRCPNCGEEHSKDDCTRPKVALDDRLCWTCNKKGHTSARCPQRRQRNQSLKTVEDGPPCFGLYTVDHEGFQTVRRGRKPQPQGATLADFIDKNVFTALQAPESDDDEVERTEPATTPKAATKANTRSGPRATPVGRANDEPVDLDAIFDVVPGSKQFQKLFPDLGSTVEDAPQPSVATAMRRDRPHKKGQGIMSSNFQRTAAAGCREECCNEDVLAPLEWEQSEDELIGNTEEEVEAEVAMDSGAVDNVIFPEGLPCSVTVEPNTTGKHFTGAGGGRIKFHGTCQTKMRGEAGREVGCQWRSADVTRALNSVSRVTGPEEHPTGHHDVLFNNKRCVVVPPGTVEKILAMLTPKEVVTEYKRRGGLYVAKMNLSGFARQGRKH